MHEGKRKPPKKVLFECVMMTTDSAVKFMSGSLDTVSDLQILMDKYSANFAEDCKLLFFVINAANDMTVEMNLLFLLFLCVKAWPGTN